MHFRKQRNVIQLLLAFHDVIICNSNERQNAAHMTGTIKKSETYTPTVWKMSGPVASL